MNIAVFVSGRGSNLSAIINDDDLKKLITIKLVISNKIDCKAFEIARGIGIEICSVGNGHGFINYEELLKKLRQNKVDLIVLAGFLKLLPTEFIREFNNKIINIHPALLPSFGGAGMYGMNVHKAVFNSSAKVTGPSIHFVNEIYDAGLIIAQKAIEIYDVISPEEIAERVLIEEHKLLPFVIKKFAENKVRILNNRVIIDK